MVTFTYTLSLLPVLASLAAADINGIDSRDMYDEIEHVMVDNNGFNNDAFINAVTPCSNYVGFASNATDRGEQTSAQWVRFIFHDFVTADVSAGTGGLDASLGYESDRIENAGLFVNDTLQFFRPTVSAYFSMSDNIALGLIASIATCGGSDSDIPMRTGRIDATEAGPSGVPEPETDLETTLAQFAAAGFNQSDTISATACGHSLGRIHYSNFPDIVPESFVTDTNLDGGEGFDTTPDVWDASVVTEYLDATGQFGGPLVTASNVSKRSDYRLYISDSNATVQAMATDLTFRDTCYSLFERMINTVPSTVSLSDPVTPLTWKAVDVALDIDTTGSVSLSAYIRNLYTTSSPTSVSYTTTTSAGNSTSETTSTIAGTGTSLYGNTTYFSLNTTISSPGVTSLNFEDVTYPINDQIFVLPEQSTVTQANDAFLIKAAALTSLVSTDSQMSAVLYVPTTVEGTITPQIVNTTITMSEYGTAGNYTLFEGSATVASSTNVIVKVVLGDQASRTVKSKIMVGGS